MKRPHKEESSRWFTQAKDEFQDADELRKRGRFYLALFHFQQATEKALKAYLYLKTKSVEIFYTRSIHELLGMALETDSDLKSCTSQKARQILYPNTLPKWPPRRHTFKILRRPKRSRRSNATRQKSY